MADIKLALQEYVATANNPEYGGDYDVINSKFPELKDIDPELLKEYLATANNEEYAGDYDVINSKFPELELGKLTDPAIADPITESSTDSGSADGLSGSVQDRTVQPNIVIPEIDPDAMLNSEDFYAKDKEENNRKEVKTKKLEEKDLYSVTKTGDKVTHNIPKLDLGADTSVARDEDALKAWLNVEYFGKGAAQKAIGTTNLSAYKDENKTEGALEKDFKAKLGKLGIDRSAFPNLTDGDLDNIFAGVLGSRVRAEKGSISKINQYVAVSDGLKNGTPIEDNVKNLSTLKINTNENKSEAAYAQAVEKLRGELTDKERSDLEKQTDLSIPGSLADLAFNEDEMVMNYGMGTSANAKKMGMYKTGKRVPKDIGFKKFHDPKTGRSLSVKEARAVRENGGTTADITDAYQSYLNSYENTSQDDLAKYNDQLLLEEAGYNIEGKKTGDYYVGDKIMRNMLTKQGYKTDVENPDIFKDVPLSALTQLSHVPGKSDFWSPDISMAKGEVIPQSFEGMPYENEEEFLDMLRVRRNQGNDIAAKNAALWDVHYLNRDPSTINKSRGGQFMGAFANSMFGEQITDEQFSQSGQDVVDVISQQIVPDSGVDISAQQEESFERTFMDKLNEGAGGMTAMLATLTPINKLDKALRISKSIMALSAPRYVSAAGKSIRQAQAIKKAAKQGKNVDDWAEAAGYTMVKASNLQKGVGLAALGVYEDIKMKEVLGGLTDGRMEFERGVGFGFALGPKLLPFGFGRFAKGKKYNLITKSTQMNTFLQSTFVNGGSFAMAVESGDLIGAVVKDLQGKKEFETWAHHHWGDRDENMSRIGLNIITGKALGLKNFDYMDFKTTTQVGEFKTQSIELAKKDLERIDKLAEANGVTPEVFAKENPNHKEVENYGKHIEDFQMASERLDLIDQTKKWTGNAAEVGKTYEDHYKPLVDMFKTKGKEVKIIVTDEPVMQEVVLPSGEVIKQEVKALYTRMKDAKDGIATIQINTKKSKGKRTANHEAVHAYTDLMFEGNIKLKEGFTKSLKEALISIKTPNSNLHKDIMEANDINKMDKLEEMMAYGAEYMGKAENAKLGSAFPGMKKFWNKFAKSTLGLEADVTMKQDVIDLMKTIGGTGNLKKLERLNEIIQEDPTGTAREGQVASAEINKTIKQLDIKKAEVLQEINDLKTAQPKGYEKIVDTKRDLYNELNTNQKSLKNKIELDAVDTSKQEGWKNQIDKNYTGTSKTKEEFQKSPEYGKVTQDIMSSTGLENMIRQAATKVGVLDTQKQKFVEDVKDRIVERFLKNYDPGKINSEYGRALTPFEYLTTGQAGGSSIVYRSAGDIMNKFKETVQTSSYDAFEGGADAYSTETGYIKADNTTGSRVEKEGIVVADALGINPNTVKKAAGDTKNLNFESDAKAKEKASYKNLGKNYKETIEKDIVVDHYGVSADVYSKMKKDASQQLNNPDIKAVQEVIKPTIETHIKLIPKWGQVSVDAITGESISQKIVSGVKSETKATGIATVLLKNKLLFKELPQTGTKGSQYEWSKDLVEYHKTMDPLFKKKFEQKVLDSWGMGETQFEKAKLSGIYKAIITQTGKAVYMQSVKQALPNTPELTMKHVLANMINQVSAGQSSSLAARDINPVTDLLKKNKISIHDIQRAMPNSPKARNPIEDLIFKRDALTRDVDVVMENERYAMENYGKTEVELQADLAESVSRSKEIAKKNRLSEKHADPNYIAKNPAEKINGVELAEWRKKLDIEVIKEMGVSLKDLEALTTKKGQSNHHALEALLVELGFGSKSRRQTLKDGTVVYLNKEGKTSAEAIEAFLGEKFTTTEGKSANKHEKVYRPDWSALKKKLDKLEKEMEGESIENIKDAKIELYRKEASYSGESKDFEATEKANREYFEDYITAVAKVAYKNKNNNGVEYMLQSRAMQTNHAKGISKSLGYKMSSLNAVGSAPGKIKTTGAKGEVKEKDNKGISNHWEHALQLLNQTNRFVKLMGKHKSVTPAFKKGLKEILDISDQHLIPKNGQLFNDAKGPTTFTEAYSKMLKKGVDNPLLNVFANKYAKLENNFVVSGPNKGKSLLDVQLESIDLKIAKKALLSIPEAKWGLFEYKLNSKIKNGKAIEIQNKKLLPKAFRKLASKDINKAIKTVDKALELGRSKNKKARGMSTFDFDETVGISNNFVIATKGGKTKKIASNEWPFVGDKMIEEGWKMDFSDFNKVTDGKPGPLMQKMKNQIKKFGPENVFILTARANESAPAIHEYLKSEGIKIPLENITGLGNSTGEAKAVWMLEKFAEGYNDMYFVDDAMPNVKAVRDVLNQLDIKSKVQQALASKDLGKDINGIMQSTFGIESNKKFSTAEGKVRGKDKKRRKFFMTDSASDLELLMEPMYGKGKKGVQNKKWFEENFYKPWERGVNDLNTARQTILNDYMGLRKQNKDIVKSLDKAVEGTNFSVDQAARVYIWNKAGFEVPGLTKTSKAKLLEYVANNPKLQAYAESVAKLTKIETGLKQPKETWWAETIATEVQETGSTTGRKKYINEWIERKNEIFTEENMAKMESELGPLWREATENMFDRMETGKTRNRDLGRIGNNVMNYLNGSVGAIMNFNTRSATLQLMSSVNFINHAENNVYAAGKAFANQPQYWKDFMTIMNSDMLKQRRDGLKINVTEAELAAAVYGPGSKAKKALSWILKQGYIPTKIADSFAISSGGATYYRNRAKMYQKQGLSLKEAEAKAFIDFAGIAEKTQQSARADLLSQQQTSFEGRLLLPFANTPMQMNRIMVKGMLDIGKGRFEGNFGENSLTSKMSQVAYYGVVQSAIFAGLQSGLFALMANSDDDEKIASTKVRAYNTMADSFLRGMGIPGVVASGVKNAGMKFYEQTQKGYGADYSEVGEALLNMSPTIGSKFSKLDAAGNSFMYNKKEILEKGFSLDNTHGIEAAATTIEAITNVPIARVLRKTENIQGALDERNENWQRGMMLLGWGGWGLGVEDHDKDKENIGPVKRSINKRTIKQRTIKFR